MSLSASVAPHIPYLRRYARALTGTQESGDSYVAALLETLIESPQILATPDEDVRITLYKTLGRMWSSVPINAKTVPSAGWEVTVQEKLATIPSASRQAFLLTAVEGFSEAQAARILGVQESEAVRLNNEANRQISSMLSGRLMIIEDEPLIAMDLEDIVESLGHTCVGVARTHREAVKLAEREQPDLVLSDIQLADGSSGIDAVSDILKMYQMPVIFITAFPERLLTGNKPEPAFLITKPFSPNMVKALIAQALFFHSPSVAATV